MATVRGDVQVNLASSKKDPKVCRQLTDDSRRYEKYSSGYRLAITTRLGSSIMSLRVQYAGWRIKIAPDNGEAKPQLWPGYPRYPEYNIFFRDIATGE
jgi:hypothetical protein